MAFKLEHFPIFPYPPKMDEVKDVEKYLTDLYRSLHDFFSILPRDIKGGIESVDLDDLANTTLSDPNADRIVFWDDGAGVYTWLAPTEGIQISATNLKADIGGLSADASPDAAADYVMTLDATDSTHKKALIEKLVGVDVKVAVDSGATADYLGAASNDGVLRTGAPLTYADGGNYVTLDWAHLGFESLADPGGDRIAFWDDSETALKWLVVNNFLSVSTANLNVDALDEDDMASDSDVHLATQQSIKAYVGSGGIGGYDSENAILAGQVFG